MVAVDPNENTTKTEIAKSPELNTVMKLAEQAGEILKRYHRTNLEVAYKRDQFDPVTIADREADELLRTGLAKHFPNDQILSEENPLLPTSYEGRVWMVDPLDDTKGYVAGRDTPGVMIGLLEKGQPTLGVIYMPFRNEWYYGQLGKGAFRVRDGATQPLKVRHTSEISDAILVGCNILKPDVRPLDKVAAMLGFKEALAEACLGAEIGQIAAGEADAFIQTSTKASKWDTLAAQTILTEAGGVICDLDGQPLDYTKPDSSWDRYVIAAGSPELLHKVVSQLNAHVET